MLGFARSGRSLVLALLSWSFFLGCDPVATGSISPRGQKAPPSLTGFDCVSVPEEAGWLLGMAAPIVERLAVTQKSPRPALLASPHEFTPAMDDTFLRLPYARPLAFHFGIEPHIPGTPDPEAIKQVEVSGNPTEAGLELARRFWEAPGTLVVASLTDPKGAVLASTLATHLVAPVVFHHGYDDELERIRGKITDLRIETVLAVRDARRSTARWPEALGEAVQTLDHAEVEGRVQRALSNPDTRTVILARTPIDHADPARSAWLAPHWSAVRRGPVLLVDSPHPVPAETAVFDYVRRHRIAPRSLTLLATTHAIGHETFTIEAGRDGFDFDYTFPVEPCSFPREQAAAPLGVGRIPSETLGEASLILAAGRIRETLSPGTTVMVSNPQLEEGGALPLAETVSRATVSEIRNLRLRVREFNRTAPNDPKVLEALESARLIVYQGHSSDNSIFATPEDPNPVLPEENEEFNFRPEGDLLARIFAARAPPTERRFEGWPVFIMQSCSSLDEFKTSVAFQSGGAGYLGSMSSIHSASGSTFVKALIGRALYHGGTVGEALRDARNYYFALLKLKDVRGHTQQAKGLRVALSFQYWGDPEIALFPGKRKKPMRPALKARWTTAGHLKVTVPAERLPEAATGKYRAEFFPGSEAAGIVRKAEGSEPRTILPVYSFRVPLPADFRKHNPTTLTRLGGKANRAVFLADSFDRYLYVVYLPSKETPDGWFTLRFGPSE